MKAIFNYFHVIRPLNVLLSGLTSCIASYILYSNNYYIIFIISLVVMIFCACANILNDLFDISTDTINNPDRPIISSNSTLFNYNLIFILIFLILFSGGLSYIYFNFSSNLFLILIFLLILIYTPFLKGIPLLGNITISLILASVFIFPAIVLNNNLFDLLYPIILTFLLTLIREIIKDIADIDGDKQSGINTFPVVFGIGYSKLIISLLCLLLIAASIYPYIIGIYNFSYLILLVLYVQVPLVSCIFYLWKYPNSQSCVTLAITTKYITIGGVLTILSTKLFT